MRFLYLDPHPVPDVTPEAIQILQTADALARVGASVRLVSPAPPPGLRAEHILARPPAAGLELHSLRDYRRAWWFPSRWNAIFYRQAKAIVAAGDAERVLVRNLKLAQVLLGMKRVPPLVFEAHELFAQSFRDSNPARGPFAARKLASLAQREKAVYRKADGLLALTSHLVEDIRAAYGVATPARVAPDGVDLDVARRAAAPPPAEPVALYLGSLHPWKGVEILVSAAKLLPQARIQIAGGTPERIAQLRALAYSLGVQDRVSFLGPVPPAERFRVIAGARICVLPLSTSSIATRYTSPLKLFEYMAMRRPIVAAAVPAIREILTHERDALLVPPGSPEALAGAISRLLQQPDLASRLCEAAYRLVETHYTWEARARTILDFASTLAAPRRPGKANLPGRPQ